MEQTIKYLLQRIEAMQKRIDELESINNIEVIDAKIL
jgi:hypothetical protein